MTNKRHKCVTVWFGAILLFSLFANLIQILIHNPRNFIDMFTLTKEAGLPFIPYISILVIFLSLIGAAGLIKYRQWGFYGIYLGCLVSTVVVCFPFVPSFILQFTSGILKSILMFIAVVGVLAALIYLHITGKRQGYFRNSIEA